MPEEIKRRRNNELLAAQQQVTAQENRKLIGQTVEVMVEGVSKLVSRQASASKVELGWEKRASMKTQLVGRTRGDQVVCFDGNLSLKGEILDVEITAAQNLTLFGRQIESLNHWSIESLSMIR